jgi:hypothetical protein
MRYPARSFLALIASLALLLSVSGVAAAAPRPDAATSPAPVSYTGIYHGARSTPSATTTSNLTYHGGSVETTPKVYISYWGPQWANTFTTGGYSSTRAQTYVNDFFTNVGGSAWNSVVTQYCQTAAVGSTDCSSVSAANHVGNQTLEVAGIWNDPASVPSKPRQADIANAALRLANHFNGVQSNATYMVFTPSGRSMTGFGTRWCAWHSSSGSMAYAYIPYIPDAGGSCGMNFVNKTNDSYGHGYFDGFSIVAGHEYSEAETDPFPSSGWVDSSGAENADKCAWSPMSADTALGTTNYWAVQPTWDNSQSGCPTVPST